MRTSKSKAILAIATTAPTYLHLQNNKLFHILQSPKPPPTAAAGVTHQTRASSVSLLASAIPTGRNETEALLFMKASGCPLAWLLVFQSRSVRLAITKYTTDETKKDWQERKTATERLQQEIYYLSLSTSSRLQQSQQTKLLAEAKHGEEKKAHGNRNKSYVTISSEQIHQEYNSKSLEMFFLLYISHLMISFCISLAEISKNGKINKANTQKRDKGAKETERKGKK